ncbi:MAG: Fe(3+) ABC transporter substrate-binding protein [Leptolyngbya sp. RL_3_1]|nr:Fe(3+) ABC transporter substrate-binding protein [Leptolyngbya sp. RL_3_1]
MKFSRRSLVLGGVAATAGLAATQLTRPRPVAAQNRGNVNLYSARHYDSDNDLYDTFTDETGIRVNLLEGDADELLERIKAEGDNSPADVFITVDAGRLWQAQRDGIFADTASDVLEANIPENLRHPDGQWFGLTKRARVFMYNKDMVDPSDLSTYEALADSRWRGQILTRSSSNIYSMSLVASLIAAHGERETEAWARALVGNFARDPEGNDRAQIEAAASGLGGLAIANTYYLPRYHRSKGGDAAQQAIFDQLGVFFPNQGEGQRGTHVNISGAGVVQTSPRKENAVRFLEYLSGLQAQTFFADANNEYPVNPDAPINSIISSFGPFTEDEVNVENYGRYQADAVRLMDRAGWV